MRSILAGGVLAAAAAWSLPGLAAEDTIKFGVMAVYSGAFGYMGGQLNAGIKMAVDEINAAGGINGKKIEIVQRDEQMKPEVAVGAAKEMISSFGVVAMIGPLGSNDALAVSEVAKEAKIPNFSPTAGSDELTGAKLNKFIFQLVSTSDVDARRMVSVFKRIGAKKICFTGYDYAYSTDLFKHIRAILPPDMQESHEYLAKLGTTDFNTLISQLMADPCDTVMNQFFGGGFISLVKQAQPFGLFKSKKFVSGGNNGDYAITSALKESFPEGLWSFSQDLWYYNPTPALQKFHDDLAKVEGKKETGMFGLNGYIAVNFLVAAIRKAGTTDGTAVAAALEGLTIDTPDGPLTIDAKTHRVGLPALYGPIVTVEGSPDSKRMSPIELMH
jgi:ABC-type branched-subunit amino acid transport system substrate-binding protein